MSGEPDTQWVRWTIDDQKPRLLDEIDCGMLGKATIVEARARIIEASDSCVLITPEVRLKFHKLA